MGAVTRFVQNPGSNAICYYRYSSDAQRDVSIVQQKDAAHEYAEHHGYHIIKEYDDPAYSGTRDDRPAFQLMLYEVEKLRPAYLILWKTDRLSRDRIDAVMAKKRLRECGVKIVYVAESIPDDDEATQILMESIYEAMAASFIVSHRKNVVRGMTYNAENAFYNGVKMLGYVGEVDHKYEVDQATAPTVRRIFKEYTEGVPMQKICDSLNNAGQKTVRGNRFTVNSLRNILVNRAYIGEYKFGKTLIPDGMPRLIDDETFQKAQAKLEANKRGGKGAIKKLHPEIEIEDYWLTGKICCGLCGGTMQGVSGTSRSGSLYYYYSCINYRKHTCTLKYQRKELMEKIVLYILDDLINDPALRIMIAEKCYAYHQAQNDDNGAYEASIRAQLKDVEGKLNNLVKAIEAGIFNSTTAERMNVLENQKSMLNDALLAEQNRKKCDLTLNTIVKFLSSLVGDINNPDTRRRLLEFFIDKIYVYPDKMVLTFYYTDDRRELPFEETVRLIDNRKKILDMMNSPRPESVVPSCALEMPLNDDDGEENLDFFP
ncbi:MAG: recombinase family protein [Oscillospiraceae bacterium]|nr:recombinase family protein [Oscillospiraceae bacterium]